MSAAAPVFDAELVARYDRPGPRYTSYPSALDFRDDFTKEDYAQAIARSCRPRHYAPLSLYVHVPFCESPCFYCGCNRVITRQRSAAEAYLGTLTAEIAAQRALFPQHRPVEQLHFGGGTPTFLDDAQLTALMAVLDSHFLLRRHPGREYSIEVDPRTVDSGRLAHLAHLGFNRVSLGVQDFEPAVQKAVNRVQSAEETLALIAGARQAGFESVAVDLIYGLPLQTRESWARTLAKVIEARPDRIAAYSYAHLPERFKAQRRIAAASLPAPAEKLALLAMTVERLCAAGYEYIGMDHFALPADGLARARREGLLHRNFQGYSTFGGLSLLGLGMSAIGQFDDCYAQNARRLDTWRARIEAGELPLEKGLRLTAEDLLRRDVIMALMCRDELRFADIEAHHGIRFTEHFAAELRALRPLQDDGLVEREFGGLRVTMAGRLLLRPIARVFDNRSATLAPPGEAPRHSKMV